MSSSRKYAYVGNVPDELDGGRPIAPGDEVECEVDKDHPQNQLLVETGKLLPLTQTAARAAGQVKANANTDKEGDES